MRKSRVGWPKKASLLPSFSTSTLTCVYTAHLISFNSIFFSSHLIPQPSIWFCRVSPIMLPIDTGCLGRPHKRPRGSSSFTGLSSDSPPSIVSPTSNQTMPKASQHLNHLGGPNLALESTSITRVARGDDRSRKLSCKECRRYSYSCSSYSHRLSNVTSFLQAQTKGKFQ